MGCTVIQWLELSPHSKKVLVLHLGSDRPGPFFWVCLVSPLVRLPPTVQRHGDSKLPICVNGCVSVCCPCDRAGIGSSPTPSNPQWIKRYRWMDISVAVVGISVWKSPEPSWIRRNHMFKSMNLWAEMFTGPQRTSSLYILHLIILSFCSDNQIDHYWVSISNVNVTF